MKILATNKTNLDIRNDRGKSALHIVVVKGKDESPEMSLSVDVKCWRFANFNFYFSAHRTTFRYLGLECIVDVLLKNGADVNLHDNVGFSPLFLALKTGNSILLYKSNLWFTANKN